MYKGEDDFVFGIFCLGIATFCFLFAIYKAVDGFLL